MTIEPRDDRRPLPSTVFKRTTLSPLQLPPSFSTETGVQTHEPGGELGHLRKQTASLGTGKSGTVSSREDYSNASAVLLRNGHIWCAMYVAHLRPMPIPLRNGAHKPTFIRLPVIA
jgi:hypothetical protein